jgi:hypothetical protein
VAPSGETTALTQPDSRAAPTPWLGYAAVLALGLALGGYLLVARRRRLAEGSGDDPDAR